ncbi:hypothetical protein MBLNU459_g6502t1 [Dothideomycetes sp. NU459]
MSEKHVDDTLPSFQAAPKSVSRHGFRHTVAFLFLTFLAVGSWVKSSHHSETALHHHNKEPQCPQVDSLLPESQSPKLVDMDQLLRSSAFEKDSIKRLSSAVQIATQSFDDMGKIGDDPRWDVFYGFNEYLEKTFPAVYEKLDVELINTHGLLFTWHGRNSILKPTLLMAHQDVVPVAESTMDTWTHPPFSGHFDGKYIWGRGSSDCKNQLIAILESVELLLDADFAPERTVVLSFGFDEEISGKEGAGHLASFLLDRYGPNSMASIVDEGAGIATSWGAKLATPGVAEKGYTDVSFTVRMPGGHSSIPYAHTSIGVISELITRLEADTYPTHLDSENPYLGKLRCGAEHAPDFPPKLRELLSKGKHQSKGHKDSLALEAAKAGPDIKYLMQTSIAVDVIGGGVKVNALPERVSAVVNYRINIGESPADVFSKATHHAKIIADKFSLALNAFNGVLEEPSSISLVASNNTLDVAPVTPTDVTSVSAYSILSGTTRALYGESLVVSPGIMTGNTDTRYYWDLSPSIFRFAPGWDGEEEGLGNIHTVDERVSIKTHVAAVQWFSLFIRNMDEAQLE